MTIQSNLLAEVTTGFSGAEGVAVGGVQGAAQEVDGGAVIGVAEATARGTEQEMEADGGDRV
jgi:hypothetical protein